MNRSREREQIQRLRRLGLTLLFFATSLVAAAAAVNYLAAQEAWASVDFVREWVAAIDPTSCMMTAAMFAMMGLFALGGAWQKHMFVR